MTYLLTELVTRTTDAACDVAGVPKMIDEPRRRQTKIVKGIFYA